VAGSARYTGGVWRAEHGWTQQFPANGRVVRRSFREQRLPLPPPEKFSGVHNQEAKLMTFGELRQYIAGYERSGIDLSEQRVLLHERIAFPLVTIVMTLLGVPFGTTAGRRGALYGMGLAIILGAVHWLVATFFLAAGQASLLPPVLAAWAANLLFLAAAGYLVLTVRT
jgi:lipopolysaccharide export system permease protein